MEKRKLIGSCFAEGILGVGMAGIIFIPSVLFTMQNPRITRLLPLDHWIYTGNRDFLQIIRTLLFPGELMNSQSCIKEYDWTSWSAYLPMIGLSLVLCYIIKTGKLAWQDFDDMHCGYGDTDYKQCIWNVFRYKLSSMALYAYFINEFGFGHSHGKQKRISCKKDILYPISVYVFYHSRFLLVV